MRQCAELTADRPPLHIGFDHWSLRSVSFHINTIYRPSRFRIAQRVAIAIVVQYDQENCQAEGAYASGLPQGL